MRNTIATMMISMVWVILHSMIFPFPIPLWVLIVMNFAVYGIVERVEIEVYHEDADS